MRFAKLNKPPLSTNLPPQKCLKKISPHPGGLYRGFTVSARAHLWEYLGWFCRQNTRYNVHIKIYALHACNVCFQGKGFFDFCGFNRVKEAY